jgi:flavodoxin
VKSVVVYASRTGNTKQIAEAIAESLRARGSVELLTADEAIAATFEDADLVLVGAPTEGHGVSELLGGFLDSLGPTSLRGVCAAAFDTRLWWPQVLAGSAAQRINERLRVFGAHVVAPPEGFIVSMKPMLKPGETERAAQWARRVADAVEAASPAYAPTR